MHHYIFSILCKTQFSALKNNVKPNLWPSAFISWTVKRVRWSRSIMGFCVLSASKSLFILQGDIFSTMPAVSVSFKEHKNRDLMQL